MGCTLVVSMIKKIMCWWSGHVWTGPSLVWEADKLIGSACSRCGKIRYFDIEL